MSTADISKDYSAMETLAKEIGDLQKDFETMCKNLDSLVDSLNGQWEGKAQVEFAAAYRKLEPKLKTIGEVLGRYSSEIANAAAAQKDLETSQANTFERTSIRSF